MDPGRGSTVPAVSPDEISTQDPPRKGAWRLTIVAGAEQGRQFTLTSLPQIIGRSNAAGILLGGDTVISRQHAEIYDRQGVLSIRDLGSLHGTQVNGITIQDRSLEPGDRIQVGGTILLVQTSEEKR
jgi:pSer/pThr/pTyr-binding forkhead associated (FHA) protein